MMRLLISVRNVAEARLLPLEQVGIIDIKEPLRGPLGRADTTTITELCREFGTSAPISAALGELIDCNPTSLTELPSVFFAKFGLSQMRDVTDWPTRWMQCIERLPTGTQPVAVIYADWKTCGAPSPEEVISVAQQFDCPAVLIDTFEKKKGNLFQWLTFSELERITDHVRETTAKLVFAGGLRSEPDIRYSLRFSPDLIGVRGAICGDDRAGTLDEICMKDFFRRFSNVIETSEVTASRSVAIQTPSCDSRNLGIKR